MVSLSLLLTLEQMHSVAVTRQSSWFQISARRPDSLSEVFNDFRHFLQVNVWMVSRRGNCHFSLNFLPNSKFT